MLNLLRRRFPRSGVKIARRNTPYGRFELDMGTRFAHRLTDLAAGDTTVGSRPSEGVGDDTVAQKLCHKPFLLRIGVYSEASGEAARLVILPWKAAFLPKQARPASLAVGIARPPFLREAAGGVTLSSAVAVRQVSRSATDNAHVGRRF